jgi:WD40 repeat protein/serine/threonine protein kinase
MKNNASEPSKTPPPAENWDDLPPTQILSHLAGLPLHETLRKVDALTELDLLLPDYRIRQLIRRGGMGAVYLAQDVKLGRQVALKMILGGHYAGENVLMRFRTEAEAIARLQHPHIIQIYEIGDRDGLPFLALEYCSGGNLEERLAGAPLEPAPAAHLVVLLAQAVHAAHHAGVIHRDLKPANVLFLADGTPKITDFGLAKMLDSDSNQTRSGELLGTPSYMAPEQAAGKNLEVGPPADVYARGAILYKLLTGRPPFRAPTPAETLLQVLENDPVPPGRLVPKTPRDLETICLKCLQKEPARRYTSASDLADDLQRYLRGDPIRAKPAGSWERVSKTVHRHPTTAALALALVLLFLVGLAGIVMSWRTTSQTNAELEKRNSELNVANRAKDEALRKEEIANAELENSNNQLNTAIGEKTQALSINFLLLAQSAWKDNRADDANKQLAADPLQGKSWESRYLKRLYQGGMQTLAGIDSGVTAIAYSPSGDRLACGTSEGVIHIWEPRSGTPLQSWKGHEESITQLVFHPDGARLASSSLDDAVILWDTQTGKPLQQHKRHKTDVFCIQFAAAGNQLISGGADGTLQVWDVDAGQSLMPLATGHDWVTCLACCSAKNLLAAGFKDGSIRLWDLNTGKERWSIGGHNAPVKALAFAPDGRLVVAAWQGSDGLIKSWDADSGQHRKTYRGHQDEVQCLAFSPDGRSIASGSRDRSILVWDVAGSGNPLALRGHSDLVSCLAFHPDGRQLAAGSLDHTIKIWDANSSEQAHLSWHYPDEVNGLAVSPDGNRLVAAVVRDLGDPDKGKPARSVIYLTSLAAGSEKVTLGEQTGIVTRLAFSPDGSLLACCSQDSAALFLWDVQKKEQRVISSQEGAALVSCTWSSDGNELLTLDRAGKLVIRNPAGESIRVVELHPSNPISAAAWHLSPWRVAAGLEDGNIVIWDGKSGQMQAAWKGHDRKILGLAFDRAGARLLSTGWDKLVKLWEVSSQKPLHHFPPGTVNRGLAVFSPDGQRLLAGDEDGTIFFWDASRGQQTLTLQGHGRKVTGMAFGPDGNFLISSGKDGWVRVWNGGP